jgi:curved DNA-binding protein CbpA
MNPHDVLGIDRGASPSQVRAAFRRFARAHHPDAGGEVDVFLLGVDAYGRLTEAPPPARIEVDVRFHRKRRGLARARGWWARRNRPSRVI